MPHERARSQTSLVDETWKNCSISHEVNMESSNSCHLNQCITCNLAIQDMLTNPFGTFKASEELKAWAFGWLALISQMWTNSQFPTTKNRSRRANQWMKVALFLILKCTKVVGKWNQNNSAGDYNKNINRFWLPTHFFPSLDHKRSKSGRVGSRLKAIRRKGSLTSLALVNNGEYCTRPSNNQSTGLCWVFSYSAVGSNRSIE